MKLWIHAAIFCASLAHSSELIVDWSLDLSNPDQYISPPLQVWCPETKSVYTVKGTPENGKNKALHRYRLPNEITGRCILSLAGGMEPSWYDGSHHVDISNAGVVVHTKMPETSAPLSFRLIRKADEMKRLELHLFKLSQNGLPLPDWGYVTDFERQEGQFIARKFIIPFTGAGEYLAYVVETSDDEKLQYLYAKWFAVRQNNLATHDHQSTLSDLQKDPRETLIEFTDDDKFYGIIAVAFVNRDSLRHIRVAQDGTIVEVHQSK